VRVPVTARAPDAATDFLAQGLASQAFRSAVLFHRSHQRFDQKNLIKANSQLQGLADDFRLPLNRGLKHFISQERLESTSSGKHQNEIASLL